MQIGRSLHAPTMEFHVAREARDRYRFDEALYTITGNVIFANFHAARLFAQRMNQKRDLANFPEQAVKSSQINAVALLHELTHYIFRMYREQQNPQILQETLGWLTEQLGGPAVEAALHQFADQFPALAVYRREQDAGSYLAGQTAGVPNREIVLEEMLMLWVENANPAFAPFMELFDDQRLEKETAYPSIMASVYDFFGAAAGSTTDAAAGAARAGGGPDGAGDTGGRATKLFAGGQNLIDILLAPARAAPHSLEAQLEFIRGRWDLSLGKNVYRLLGGLDLIKEEEKPVFFGPGPVEIPVFDFATRETEPEQFSPDREWMPQLVLMAKNAYVWLDQLAKDYGRPVRTLDEVPDAELDKLARWGVTGLWLIGLWERSAASQRMKQMMGNPEAVASAYSLFDYVIAKRLGGEAACQNLRERAWQRGIRLSSDMVPNHVGIDGRWVIEHPDWFLSAPDSPYPSYTFNGPDLSWDESVGIYLEDHYYERTDAAVVFKRVDRRNGDERYIYHGNDGTSMPWNDTAQLNYIRAEVREGVIQTILHVARQFPVIRFDAAMTLAKKHIERLWFPEPGSGGAIPSRSEYAMTKAEFDALIPDEFWREVVDRVAAEAPDTLLLAEAFWLMESYFVRTLGMHRVYNSAFMHLLRDEDNAKYRGLMKQTLEFDPEILKRYVNFQNNPDERTAVDQFGKGDKYFGICAVMLTLPGLPMLGHGQIEGFAEKYGMEYQRAYWDEQPNRDLIERHEREIFPLAHKRYLFAGVEHFLLYDFLTAEGGVAEDVYAYSNRQEGERALVVYHNKRANVRGWVRMSAPYSVKTSDDASSAEPGERTLIQRSLGEGLGLNAGDDIFYIFRDYVTGLEYLRAGKELAEQGLYVELGGYTCHAFLDFREVRSDAIDQYAYLAGFLAGRGVPSIDEALKELFLQPLHYPFKELVNADLFGRLLGVVAAEEPQMATGDELRALAAFEDLPDQDELGAPAAFEDLPDQDEPAAPELAAQPLADTALAAEHSELLAEVEQKMLNLLREIKHFSESEGDPAPIAREVRDELAVILRLPQIEQRFNTAVQTGLADNTAVWGCMFGWAFVHALGKISGAADYAGQSRSWIDEWRLGRIVNGVLREIGVDEYAAGLAVMVLKHMTTYQDWFVSPELRQTQILAEALLADNEIQQLLRVNRYQDTLWFDQNAFEQLLAWLLRVAMVAISADAERASAEADAAIRACVATTQQLLLAAEQSGYQVEKLRELVGAAEAPKR